MENYQNSLSGLNVYEKFGVKKIVTCKYRSKNNKCNCKPLFKYVISKTKIHKNVSTI